LKMSVYVSLLVLSHNITMLATGEEGAE
jgi:hypothetical protein